MSRKESLRRAIARELRYAGMCKTPAGQKHYQNVAAILQRKLDELTHD